MNQRTPFSPEQFIRIFRFVAFVTIAMFFVISVIGLTAFLGFPKGLLVGLIFGLFFLAMSLTGLYLILRRITRTLEQPKTMSADQPAISLRSRQSAHITLNKNWHPYKNGKTMGQRGSENGLILLDDEHVDGARVTLEQNGHTSFAITCGIYGWMVHTCFFSNEQDARQTFGEIKMELELLIDLIRRRDDELTNDKTASIAKILKEFTEKY